MLKNKKARSATVRIPMWVDREKVGCQVGDEAVELLWVNNYVAITGLKQGDEITIVFPMKERRATYRIATGDYTFKFRGNTAISVDPKGIARPLYQREKEVARFGFDHRGET